MRQNGRVFRSFLDVVSFNIQNSIPHKSQKTKVLLETNRAEEFQTGTTGVKESAKEGARVPSEGLDTYLGCGSREFKSRHSDHQKDRRLLSAVFYHVCVCAGLE